VFESEPVEPERNRNAADEGGIILADQEHGSRSPLSLDKAGPINFPDKIVAAQERSWKWSIAPDATTPGQRLSDALSRQVS
jgi:hypothetical protein